MNFENNEAISIDEETVNAEALIEPEEMPLADDPSTIKADGQEENVEIESSSTIEESEKDEDKPDAAEVAYLKAELESLKKELSESRAFIDRMESECSEFSSLYPGVPLSTLPDSVWKSVKSGVPLSAAYALEVRRAEMDAKRAGIVNEENRNMSTGAVSSDNYNDYFSPSQVKAMSAKEVRANYTKIINSMSKWH